MTINCFLIEYQGFQSFIHSLGNVLMDNINITESLKASWLALTGSEFQVWFTNFDCRRSCN